MINKFQQGGKQDVIMQFIQGLAQTLQADPNQIIQIAQQNPKALEAAVQTYQQTQDMNQAAQAFQQGIQAARHGAKLNYIKSLKHQCAEDEELYYYKKGGSVDCGCVKKEQKGGKTTKVNNSVEAFKKARGKANEADTVHVAGKIYSTTNSDGSPVDKRFPAYSGKVEQKDRQAAKAGNKDAKKRQFKQDMTSSEKCGGKVKKHQGGGWIQMGIANPYINITERVVNPDNKYQWVKRTINSNPGGLPNDTVYKAGNKSGFPKDQNSLKNLFNNHYIENPEWNKKQNMALFLQKIINTKLKGDKLMNGYIPKVK